MRLVYLFRHGIAIDRTDPRCPVDADRSLTEKGERRTARAVRGLAAMGVTATRIWTSPYERARQTAVLAQEGLELATKIEEWPDMTPGGAFATTARRLWGTQAEPVLLAGHAPHLDELVTVLSGARIRLKKAGCACIDLDERRLVWLLEARTLRSLG